MKFEKKVVHILFLFLLICVGSVAALTLLFGDFDLLQNELLQIQFYSLITVLGSIFIILQIAKLTRIDREIFIKSLLAEKSNRYRWFREFRRLKHSYILERHSQRLDGVEKMHLEDVLEHKNYELQATEKDIVHLENELELLDHRIEEYEFMFMAIANAVEEGIWVADRDGKVTFINNFMVKQMHVTVGDHISGVFCLNEEDCSFFNRRDFKDIEVKLWDSKGTKVLLSNARIFYADTLNNNLFYCKNIRITEDIIKRNQDFNFISDTFDTLSKNVINKQSIENYLERMCLFGEFKSASIRLLGSDKKTLDIYTIFQDSVFVLNKEKQNIANSHMGLAYRLRNPVLLNHVDDMRMKEPIVRNALQRGLTISFFPLRIQGIDIGVLSIISDKALSNSMVLLIKSVCINLTIALEKILIYDRLKNNFFDIIGAFFMALEMKSQNMRGHSSRVAMVCKLIAEQLYYSGEEIDNLYSAALLHDVGKLLFVDKSYKHVFDIREHGYLGRMIMERVGASKDIIQGIEYHHDDFRSEKGVQPIYPQFIRLANDFDMYFQICPTLERAQSFIDKIGRKTEGEYSPNLVNVLEYIIQQDFDSLMNIYGVSTEAAYA